MVYDDVPGHLIRLIKQRLLELHPCDELSGGKLYFVFSRPYRFSNDARTQIRISNHFSICHNGINAASQIMHESEFAKTRSLVCL